jgi:hypothetical protein
MTDGMKVSVQKRALTSTLSARVSAVEVVNALNISDVVDVDVVDMMLLT